MFRRLSPSGADVMNVTSACCIYSTKYALACPSADPFGEQWAESVITAHVAYHWSFLMMLFGDSALSYHVSGWLP
jgi:hypothetical protein